MDFITHFYSVAELIGYQMDHRFEGNVFGSEEKEGKNDQFKVKYVYETSFLSVMVNMNNLFNNFWKDLVFSLQASSELYF